MNAEKCSPLYLSAMEYSYIEPSIVTYHIESEHGMKKRAENLCKYGLVYITVKDTNYVLHFNTDENRIKFMMML